MGPTYEIPNWSESKRAAETSRLAVDRNHSCHGRQNCPGNPPLSAFPTQVRRQHQGELSACVSQAPGLGPRADLGFGEHSLEAWHGPHSWPNWGPRDGSAGTHYSLRSHGRLPRKCAFWGVSWMFWKRPLGWGKGKVCSLKRQPRSREIWKKMVGPPGWCGWGSLCLLGSALGSALSGGSPWTSLPPSLPLLLLLNLPNK